MATETPIAFSFLRLNNLAKGLFKAHAADDVDQDWLEKRADQKQKKAWQEYNKSLKQAGVVAPKVKYPVLFGKGDNQYQGLMAVEDIGKNEVMIKVPSSLIINTKKAFYCPELRDLYYDNPEVFGKHTPDGEDNVYHTFVLWEMQKKEKSQYYQMIKMWPKNTDILMNWGDSDLEMLQDPTLTQEARKQYNQVMRTWNRLYKCLSRYPELFKPETIGFSKFKWVYILTMNRCFASNWPCVSQMVPFADQINHENVNVFYDCHDPVTGATCVSVDEKRAREAKEAAEKKEERTKYLEALSTDLAAIADDLDATEKKDREEKDGADSSQKGSASTSDSLQIYKDLDEHNVWRIKTQGYLSKIQQDQIDERCDDIKAILAEKKKRAERIKNAEDELSSGLESDNDLDLLVEQEVIRAVKLRKQYKQALRRRQLEAEQKEQEEAGQPSTGNQRALAEDDSEDEDDDDDTASSAAHKLSKDQVFEIYHQCFKDVPDEYDFVISSNTDAFPKGSQVYLCYGRMSNRDALKRYGFCLTHNKYNHMSIKLRLEQNDPDFRYRHYVIQKFFSVDTESKDSQQASEESLVKLEELPSEDHAQLDVQSRHFRIYYQRLNTKVLKFIKILTYNVHEDDLQCIVETRSLSLEYLSFKKLLGVYERFLQSFPTDLKQDLELLRGPGRKDLSVREYFAVLYRSEQKRILVNQIKLVKVVTHILERLMKGMTLDFAVTRVFELESKQDFVLNRKMIDNYLTSLKNGLQKNKEAYLKLHNLTEEQMQAIDAATLDQGSHQRRMRPTEVKGYEQMLSRMLDAPLESSERNKNWTLQQKLLKIKEQLGTQGGLMPPIPNMVEYEAATQPAPHDQKATTQQTEKKKGLPDFMKAQHEHLQNLRRQMENRLAGNGETQPEEEAGAAKEDEAEKKEGDESSSGEYTYGSDDDDDDDDDDDEEEESSKDKQIEETGGKTSAKAEQTKDAPMTDAEILARVQQKQVEEFYSCAEGSFLSDLAQLQDIQEQLSKEMLGDRAKGETR